MKIVPVWSGILLLGLAPLAGAETVYRSVGEDGQVIFSDTPPSDAKSSETVNLLPPLSEERRKEAEARQQKLIELVGQEKEQQAEEETTAEDKLAEAKQAVEDARKGVDQAKAIRPDDWWMGVGSGQLLPKYQERVRQAEQKLEAAERNLRLVRSGQR